MKITVKSSSDGICPFLNVLIYYLYYSQAGHESIPEESQTCLGLGRKVCLMLPVFVLHHTNLNLEIKKKYNICFSFLQWDQLRQAPTSHSGGISTC